LAELAGVILAVRSQALDFPGKSGIECALICALGEANRENKARALQWLLD